MLSNVSFWTLSYLISLGIPLTSPIIVELIRAQSYLFSLGIPLTSPIIVDLILVKLVFFPLDNVLS